MTLTQRYRLLIDEKKPLPKRGRPFYLSEENLASLVDWANQRGREQNAVSDEEIKAKAFQMHSIQQKDKGINNLEIDMPGKSAMKSIRQRGELTKFNSPQVQNLRRLQVRTNNLKIYRHGG